MDWWKAESSLEQIGPKRIDCACESKPASSHWCWESAEKLLSWTEPLTDKHKCGDSIKQFETKTWHKLEDCGLDAISHVPTLKMR